MQKISGIIPSSSRVTTVDMRDSSPVRSGAPSFGRQIFKPENRLSKSNVDKALSNELISGSGKKDMQNSKVVTNMASDFFMHKSSNAQPTINISDPLDVEYAEDSSLEEPEFIAPGSYLDVKV